MKKTALFLFIVSLSVSAYSQKLDRLIDSLIIDFSLEFKKANPNLVYKPNIGVIPFSDSSATTKKYYVGETVAALIESKIAKSLYFTLRLCK